MDTTTARHLAEKAAAAVLRHGHARGARQQTLTVSTPVDDVLRASRDPDVLATLLGDDGSVEQDGPDRFSWTLADTTIATTLQVQPNRVVFSAEDTSETLVVEAWPAPRWGGSEVVLRLALPAPDAVTGALAFTMLYRLRALLQTGEVPTLGAVPSGRSGVRTTDDGNR